MPNGKSVFLSRDHHHSYCSSEWWLLEKCHSSQLQPFNITVCLLCIAGRQVGPDHTCREKLEKTIILFTKVVSKSNSISYNQTVACFVFKCFPSSTLQWRRLTIFSIVFYFALYPLDAVVRLLGVPPISIHTSDPALLGICRQLRVHSCRGGGHLWTLHCPVHEPH